MSREHLIPFTSETAKLASAKSAIARQAKAHFRVTQEKLGAAKCQVANKDLFKERALWRVRLQMDRVLDQLQKAKDGGQLDKLASALVRLYELESALSGRRKPRKEKPADRQQSTPDIEPLPPAIPES